MPNVKVLYDTNGYTIEEGEDSDEQYSWQGVTGTDNTINGIEQVSDNSFSELVTDFDIVPGESYYLLYAIYSTGDSFSRSEGEVEFVGLYKDPTVAKSNADRIWDNNEHHDSSHSVNLVTEDGKEYLLSVPWKGYFENLSDVSVKTVGGSHDYSAARSRAE